MDFQQRLGKAIERGQRANELKAAEAAARELSKDELHRLHTQYRLELSEHIEQCLKVLPQHFPGFQFDTLVSELGWGAQVVRDDIGIQGGRRNSYFSRLQIAIRPFSELHVLELVAKGTIRNKEVFNRSQYQKLREADPHCFQELIDLWTLEYAEMYARQA